MIPRWPSGRGKPEAKTMAGSGHPFPPAHTTTNVPLMDTTPQGDDRHVEEEVVSRYSGKTWRVVRDTQAEDDGLTDEEDEEMLQASMERQERIIERMYGTGS